LRRLVYDLETNGLLLDTTKIHCGTIYDLDTGKSYMFSDDESMVGWCGSIKNMITKLQSADLVIGHNIIKFDNMVIQKLYNINLTKESNCIDTLICSKLMYPDAMKLDTRRRSMPPKLKGKHSLRAWGYRLKTMKDDYDGGWEELNQEMFDYCRQDGVVTASIYNHFLEQGLPPQEAIELEQNFAHIIARQEMYGVLFDVKEAQKLHIELEEDKLAMEQEVFKVFKPLPIFTKKNEIKNKYKKDGTISMVYQKQLDRGFYFKEMEDGSKVWGVDVITEFNPSSRQHIAYWMKTLFNWESPEKTEKGNPVINEGILKGIKDIPEAQILAQYFNVTKLLGQLALGPQAWLKQVGDDGRIHGQVDTLGAVTRRCTHSRPNMAQVPSPRAYKGPECRKLFKAKEGYKIVGCDASGLELRVLAHYMAKYDGGKYGRTILEGDIHTENQKAAGLPTRDNAKTFIYGFLYGAGAAKLGEIVGGGYKEGDKLKKRFLRKLPAIAKLSEAVINAVKKNGTLRALDGNPYLIRSEHSALNVLLQGAGALVIKYWNVECDRIFQEEKGWIPGVDYEQILSIHDECQWEVKENIVEEFKKVTEEAFHIITKKLNFRIRLDGEAKDGINWYQTH
jgi:DNA polymerase I-like protein with 3'-5' exonuclease and polymerase domains